MTDDKFITIDNVRLVRKTEKAGLFALEDGEEMWIPFSQVEGHDEETGDLTITRWIAEQKGLLK